MEASHVEPKSHHGQGVPGSHTRPPIVPGPQDPINVPESKTPNPPSALSTRTPAAGPETLMDETPTAPPPPAASDPKPQSSQTEPAIPRGIEVSLSNGKALRVSTTSQRSAEIIKSTFEGKTLLSEEEMIRVTTTPGMDTKLGFNQPGAGNMLLNMPTPMCFFAEAYITGNEKRRQQENSQANHQFYQPPDQAKITAAKAYVQANELATETLKTIDNFDQNFEEIFLASENVSQRDADFQQNFSAREPKRKRDFQKQFKSTRTWGQRILDFFRERFNLFGAAAYEEEKSMAREVFDRSCLRSERESYEHSCRQQAKEKYTDECRKHLVKTTVEFCANSDFYITALEPCLDTNNGFKNFERVFHPLPQAITPPLSAILKNKGSKFTAESLKLFSQEYGQELLDTAVQSLYKAESIDRESLAEAYQEYYSSISKECPNLNGMIFNAFEELQKLYSDVQNLIKQKTSEGKGLAEAKEEAYGNLDFQRRWEELRPKLIKREEDGGITLDLGHIKVMVNGDQEKYLTFKNVFNIL
ncbi:MAG: hypothetical protein LBF94_00415 [Puniceicoccales bacterium]|jgi:hypothetical protein|nr:hypothetical protein [Puniceicoccales bacterium]